MERNSTSLRKWAMTYGLYLGIFHMLFILFLYSRNQMFDSGTLEYLSLAIIVGVTWFGLANYRDKVNKGILSYGQGVGLGVLISVFAGVFSATTIYMLMTFDKSLSDLLLVITQENLMKSGWPDELIENMSKMYEIAIKPGMVAFSEFFGKVFIGTLISLIVAIVVKRKPESSFYDAVKNID
jgi:hypothetical protein